MVRMMGEFVLIILTGFFVEGDGFHGLVLDGFIFILAYSVQLAVDGSA